MAIGIVATIKIQPGKNAELESVAKELMAAVRKNEPGNKLYQFFKSKTDENTYVVMEMYDDAAAVEAHRNSDHFKTLGPKMGPAMAGRPDVQLFDAI
ncbi:MAG TPA: putative quinol monooxygenase [Rhizomicrobium sp.]|nr:putative quinol monooxygenase [Rhizomicrobium sp.]